MNVYDLVSRAEAISKQYASRPRYEKYTKEPDKKGSPDKIVGDSFAFELETVRAKVIDLRTLAEEITQIKERPLIAARNAEVRRRKNAILADDILALKKAASKGKVTKDDAAARHKQIDELEESIYAVHDGFSTARRKPGSPPRRAGLLGAKKPHVEIEVGDMKEISENPGYYDMTDENRAFEQEWQESKSRQDDKLDVISRGVGNLKNIAEDMKSELKTQDVLVDDIEANMDKATQKIQTNNAKLAGVLRKVRSQRNFCLDIILLIVVLALGTYIYTLVA